MEDIDIASQFIKKKEKKKGNYPKIKRKKALNIYIYIYIYNTQGKYVHNTVLIEKINK